MAAFIYPGVRVAINAFLRKGVSEMTRLFVLVLIPICFVKSLLAMRVCALGLAGAAIMLLVCSCRTDDTQGLIVEKSPNEAEVKSWAHTNRTWKLPSDLPVFANTARGSIIVTVYGRSVNWPGIYYLRRRSTVQDAIGAAHGLKEIVGWEYPYSGIERLKEDGSVETIWFHRNTRTNDEQTVLQDFDRLCISHEVY